MSDTPQPAPGQPYAQPGQPYTQPGQPYGAQPGQPYGAQPGHPYGAQPGQPGQPYGAQPGQPYGAQPGTYGPASPAPVSAGNPVGRTAFLVTVIAVGVGLVGQFLLQLLYASIGFQALSGVSSILEFLVFVGAAAGLVLGIAALRRPAPHLLAAIAIGIAGSTLAGTLVSVLSSAVYNLGF
ncbi:hypothetical protein [Microbacterium sp. 3J1]|uniref:hypothetical protein n=1 Tax=Microbacterium sp. 3J1 TaxID=861269 RepID=UPI000A89A4AE|nr:hypothetical protein [Microbacterium sp. 3J1]